MQKDTWEKRYYLNAKGEIVEDETAANREVIDTYDSKGELVMTLISDMREREV